jgi:hypothetical protein
MTARREYVYRLALRGYTIDMIVQGIRTQGEKLSFGPVSRRTVARDITAVRQDLLRTKTMSNLYSLGKAFHEYEEAYRETWQQYARPPIEIVRQDGSKFKVDDRMVKVAILRLVTDLVTQKARLCGFFSPKVIEQLTLMETAEGRGLQHTKITIREEDLIVARLKSDKEFARREGINPDDPTGAGHR